MSLICLICHSTIQVEQLTGGEALAYMIVPRFSSVTETKGDTVINPSLSVRGGSPFHFLQVSPSVSDPRK